MALQIANTRVVDKVSQLARRLGLSKTAVVEQAVDRLAGESSQTQEIRARALALLAQLDRVPDRTDAHNPLEWDAQGLPR